MDLRWCAFACGAVKDTCLAHNATSVWKVGGVSVIRGCTEREGCIKLPQKAGCSRRVKQAAPDLLLLTAHLSGPPALFLDVDGTVLCCSAGKAMVTQRCAVAALEAADGLFPSAPVCTEKGNGFVCVCIGVKVKHSALLMMQGRRTSKS